MEITITFTSGKKILLTEGELQELRQLLGRSEAVPVPCPYPIVPNDPYGGPFIFCRMDKPQCSFGGTSSRMGVTAF